MERAQRNAGLGNGAADMAVEHEVKTPGKSYHMNRFFSRFPCIIILVHDPAYGRRNVIEHGIHWVAYCTLDGTKHKPDDMIDSNAAGRSVLCILHGDWLTL